jgi:hypothetical protein
MAKTLLDTLKQRQENPETSAITPQQQQIQKVMAAKTGKAQQGATGLTSNIGEQSAIQAAKTQVGQQVQAGKVSGAQLGQAQSQQQQEQKTAQQGLQTQQSMFETGQAAQATGTRAQLEAQKALSTQKTSAQEQQRLGLIQAQAANQLQQLASEKNIAVNDIFANLERENKDLASRKDAAELEQKAFLLSLQNKAYVNEINQVGSARNLQDAQAYELEAQRVIWGNAYTDLINKLGWQSAMNQKDRDLEKTLADMNIDVALQMNSAAIRSNNEKAQIEGTTQVVTTGTKAALDYQTSQDKQDRQETQELINAE